PSADAVAAALRGLAARGLARAVLQPHVDGDLVKFYGIGAGGGPHGEPPWFRWFYHKEQTLAGHRFDERRLARLVRGAAAALGLEVYGGDAIVAPDGSSVLLDVNAWPSFALFRDEAAPRLATAATAKAEVVGFWGGFHGKTGGVLPLLGSDFKHHLGPFMPGRYLSPYADCYRCPLKLRYPDCGIACAEFVRDVIRYQTAGEVGAIIVEPVQGTAGNVVPPEGFVRAVQAIAREHGALLIV